MERIAANSVLPAIREPLTLVTSDGLELVGELARPEQPVGTIVCAHPLPTHGGMMDSHLFRKAAWRLPALADIAVLRFNTRGTSSAAGTSQGEFDEAQGEGLDLAAAVARAEHLPNIWLVGWSFGTDIVLRHGLLPGVQGAILLSPPLRYSTDADLDAWAADGRQLVVMVPEHDDFLPPAAAQPRFARIPQARMIAVPGAKHLWVGEKYTRIVLDQIVSTVTGRPTELPSEYDGPMEKWSDL